MKSLLFFSLVLTLVACSSEPPKPNPTVAKATHRPPSHFFPNSRRPASEIQPIDKTVPANSPKSLVCKSWVNFSNHDPTDGGYCFLTLNRTKTGTYELILSSRISNSDSTGPVTDGPEQSVRMGEFDTCKATTSNPVQFTCGQEKSGRKALYNAMMTSVPYQKGNSIVEQLATDVVLMPQGDITLDQYTQAQRDLMRVCQRDPEQFQTDSDNSGNIYEYRIEEVSCTAK